MQQVWGKWGELSEPLPLLAHLLDTASVALLAWQQFSPSVRANATALLAPDQEDLARARFAALAAVHDCGKAGPDFQGQEWSRNAAQFAAHRQALSAAGLSMTMPPSRPRLPGLERLWLRHEAVTSLILGRETELPAWARRVVAGHHGRYQPAGPDRNVPIELDALAGRTHDSAWTDVHRSLLKAVLAAVRKETGVDVSFEGWPRNPAKRLVPFVVALTGLVCVCDWIASDEAFVMQAPVHLLKAGYPFAYLQERSAHVEDALDGVLLGSGTPLGDFAALFDGQQPRGGAQEWAVSREHGPGLAIVMTNMGEGKTEVALYMHAKDASTAEGEQAGDGLFFGLPTMATADAMFERGQRFWAGTRATGRLAHSQAVLHDFYAPTSVRPIGVCDHDTEGGLQPDDWFSGRHRGLIAHATFGTCDQVLAAALSHKFLAVRLGALAGKHVVLDEIHTYDPYQHWLLRRLLGWLGAYRCRVTLLSATLPRERVAELVRAWSEGWQGAPAPACVSDVVDSLPPVLPYPSVVTVGDELTCTPLTSWRSFALQVRAHRLPADRDTFAAATAELVQRLRAEQPQARIGVIVNTVDRAIAVYRMVRGADRVQDVLLHSRMTSRQRSERTATLHGAVGKDAPAGPVLVVATQVAEASLDLDFDILVTDLAPMSSLCQRTGRLWRHSTHTGTGWTHPERLAYRQGDPTVHVLVPVNGDGQFAAGLAALPYTAAELRKTWDSPACLAGGQRTLLRVPEDMQAAVDAAHVSFADLVSGLDQEAKETREVLAALAGQLVKTAAAEQTGYEISRIARTWPDADGPDPWGKQDPDWSGLTAPTLWSTAGTGDVPAVTRLQDTVQAQVLLYDPTAQSSFAWHGTPVALQERGVERQVLLDALAAVVPVSGRLATQCLDLAREHAPHDWTDTAPALLRGLSPVPVSAFAGFAALDPDLGLIRLESA